jgi:hypothetical protein
MTATSFSRDRNLVRGEFDGSHGEIEEARGSKPGPRWVRAWFTAGLQKLEIRRAQPHPQLRGRLPGELRLQLG